MFYHSNKKIKYFRYSIILIIIFIFISLVKIFFICKIYRLVPTIWGDELIFRLYAQKIFELKPYFIDSTKLFNVGDPFYPPFYPLFLSTCLFFADFIWYKAMIILNAILSSLIIFASYFLANKLLSKKYSFAIAILSGSLPVTVIYVPSLMAENISISILIFTIALAFHNYKSNNKHAILFGLALFFCYFTKYIFLLIIPPVFIIYLLNQYVLLKNFGLRNKLIFLLNKSLIILSTFSILFILWIILTLYSKGELLNIIGYGVSRGDALTTYSSQGLVFFSILHLTTIVLALCPFLPFILYFYSQIIFNFNNIKTKSVNYVVLYSVLLLGFYIVSTQNSWRNALIMAIEFNENFSIQNLKHPLSSRWLIYFLPLVLPIFALGLKEIVHNIHLKKTLIYLSICFLVSAIFTILSYKITFSSLIWDLGSSKWMTGHWVVSPDIMFFYHKKVFLGISFPILYVIFCFLFITFLFIIHFLKGKINVLQKLKKGFFIFFCILIFSYAYMSYYNSSIAHPGNNTFDIDEQLAKIIKQNKNNLKKSIVVIDPSISEYRNIQWKFLLDFWLGEYITVEKETSINNFQNDFDTIYFVSSNINKITENNSMNPSNNILYFVTVFDKASSTKNIKYFTEQKGKTKISKSKFHNIELIKNCNFSSTDGWSLTKKSQYNPKTGIITATVSFPANQAVLVDPGVQYLNTIEARSAKKGALGRIQVNWMDANGKFISTNINVFECTPNWTKFTMKIIAPENAAVAIVYVTGHTKIPVEFKSCSFKE